MHHNRETGTKLPMMYRRQPEYVDNGKQYFADPDDDIECRPEPVTGKQKKPRNSKRNKAGVVLGINLLLLGVVLYLMQSYLISNNGVLTRDGMRYEVKASEIEGAILVSVIVRQEEDRSELSGKILVAEVSLSERGKSPQSSTAIKLDATMPETAGEATVVQATLDIPDAYNRDTAKNYAVRVHFNAGQSNIVVNSSIRPVTGEGK